MKSPSRGTPSPNPSPSTNPSPSPNPNQVSVLGAIGFTMCLLLTEVSMPAALQPLPKLVVLVSSALASCMGALIMSRLRPFDEGEEGGEARTPVIVSA